MKKYIKSTLNYRKRAFWIGIAVAAVCIVVIICFLSNQSSRKGPDSFDANMEFGGFRIGGELIKIIDEPLEENTSPILDLNRNGIEESIRQTEIDNGNGLAVEIYENGERIFYGSGEFVHAGWTAYFLCILDGESYLLHYNPTIYQGIYGYSYELFTLKDGYETIKYNSVIFDVNFDAPHHVAFEPDAIAEFMDEINGYLAHSTQLLNTDQDLLDTFERTGKLEDDLSTLFGSWESEFSRDESKSLEENLRLLQETLEADDTEPHNTVSSAGLPFDDILEMMFCSGAGAWQTRLALNTDGSFTGEFVDADMGDIGDGYPNGTQYVCQFHGRFKDIRQLSDASWSLTLEELVLDTGHEIGEEWIEDGVCYIASGPYGFSGAGDEMPGENAEFILYSPEARGHAPGTELYGALEFQSWMPHWYEFQNSDECLNCYGLHNLETGYGFFSFDGWGIE